VRGSSRRRARRILVVEDNDELRTYLTALLGNHGYLVSTASNGAEAMVALTNPDDEGPEAVLLDLCLPLESGVSVLSFTRNVLKSGAPVVVLTGQDDPEMEAAVKDLGVSAYLKKPVVNDTLIAAVERALS